MVQLQLQQGVLGPWGLVNSSTVGWKSVPPQFLTNYHTLTYNSRGMSLNQVKGQSGVVVTGVRFTMSNDKLVLNARVRKFHYATGKLHSTAEDITAQVKIYFVLRTNYYLVVFMFLFLKDATKELILDNPDVPTRTGGQNVMNLRTDQLIKFTTSGWLADAAQTVVPYLDIQEVVTNPPCALSGVGMYHKAAQGSGGFIAPRVYTYDFSYHFVDD